MGQNTNRPVFTFRAKPKVVKMVTSQVEETMEQGSGPLRTERTLRDRVDFANHPKL
jgi:hypothetical protein